VKRLAITGLIILGLPGSELPGQETTAPPDSVTLVPGARYGTGGPFGWLSRWMFGDRYRDLWSRALQAEVLDVRTFEGGLRAIRADTGSRTGYLYLRSRTGHDWTFRTADVDLTAAMPNYQRREVIAGVLQDLASSRHPGAAVVVTELARATGAAVAPATMVVLWRDSAADLMERPFIGVLGFLQPGIDTMETPSFGEMAATVSTGELLERLRGVDAPAVDTASYLRERLFDVYLGHWDPAPEMWRWASPQDDTGRWVPLPRNRDQAFSRIDGLITVALRTQYPFFSSFGEEYDPQLNLTPRTRIIDQRIIAPLYRYDFRVVAESLQARLTDSVIDRAVGRLPQDLRARNGETLTRQLRRRRDLLPDAAERFYDLLIGSAEVYGTDAAEPIVADLPEDGVLDLRVGNRFARRFLASETREVNLFPLGGQDRVVVRGPGRGAPLLRIAAWSGDSVVDSSQAGRYVVHDPGGVEVISLRKATVDPEPFGEPLLVDPAATGPPPYIGTRRGYVPWLGFSSDVGLLVGVGVVRTTYDNGYEPWQARYRLRAGFATAAMNGGVEFRAEWRRRRSTVSYVLDTHWSQIEVLRFYGFGNDTQRDSAKSYYRTGQRELLVSPYLNLPFGSRSRIEIGPIVKYVSTRPDSNSLIAHEQPYGTEEGFGQAGAFVRLTYDTRDAAAFAKRGIILTAGATGYPALWGAEEAFGEVHGSLGGDVAPFESLTLAARVSAQYAWGKYPAHEAAFLGGSRILRGFKQNRYAGDVAVYGNSDIRLRLTSMPFVVRWDVGLQAVADVGRVYLDGETSNTWHYGFGGGLWMAMPNRSMLLLGGAAKSDDGRAFWFSTKFPF
jgi:hypothetical protein